MPELNPLETAIQNALNVASLLDKLASGVIETGPGADLRLISENVFERRTYTSRNVQHLKRLMSQTWFTDALTMEQFMTINDAIVKGEEYMQ